MQRNLHKLSCCLFFCLFIRMLMHLSMAICLKSLSDLLLLSCVCSWCGDRTQLGDEEEPDESTSSFATTTSSSVLWKNIIFINLYVEICIKSYEITSKRITFKWLPLSKESRTSCNYLYSGNMNFMALKNFHVLEFEASSADTSDFILLRILLHSPDLLKKKQQNCLFSLLQDNFY